MRLLRGAVIVLTGLTMGTTLWLAGNTFPVDVGLLVMGLSVSIGGIFVIAFTQPTRGENE